MVSAFLLGTLSAYSSDLFAPDKTDPVAAGMDPVRLARIHAKMKAYVDEGTAAGFVTIVVRHGNVAFLDAVGYQDREVRIPMSKDTIFRIASMTKSFTVAGVMILVDEGRLSLLDPVEQFLPEFKGMKVNPCSASPASTGCETVDAGRPITVLDLMTHTSGLPGQGAQGAEPFKSLAERVSVGAHIPLLAQPGTKWIYSQIGYAALGRLIEVISGKPYEEFLAERLFHHLRKILPAGVPSFGQNVHLDARRGTLVLAGHLAEVRRERQQAQQQKVADDNENAAVHGGVTGVGVAAGAEAPAASASDSSNNRRRAGRRLKILNTHTKMMPKDVDE